MPRREVLFSRGELFSTVPVRRIGVADGGLQDVPQFLQGVAPLPRHHPIRPAASLLMANSLIRATDATPARLLTHGDRYRSLWTRPSVRRGDRGTDPSVLWHSPPRQTRGLGG